MTAASGQAVAGDVAPLSLRHAAEPDRSGKHYVEEKVNP